MKVVKKSSDSRQTLTLPARAVELIDQMRGDAPKSRFVHELLEREARRREREEFYQRVAEAYTAEVCEETLSLNAEYPVHEQ